MWTRANTNVLLQRWSTASRWASTRTLAPSGTILQHYACRTSRVGYEVPLPSGPAHKTPAPPGTELLHNIPVALHGVWCEVLLPGTQTLAPRGTELLHNIPVALHGVGYEVPLPSGPAQIAASPGTELLHNIPVTLNRVRNEVPLPSGPAHGHRLPQAQNYSIIYLSHWTESEMKYRSPVGRHTDTGSPRHRTTP